MANTGFLIYLTITVDGTPYDIPEDANAQEVVEIVANGGQTISVNQAQNWIDNRRVPCDNEPNCDECNTCFEVLPVNEFYADRIPTNESYFIRTAPNFEECLSIRILP